MVNLVVINSSISSFDMKRFLIYVFSVLVPVALILGVCEYLVRQVPNPYKYKEEWMEKHHNEVETLILGGSHMFYGVKPDLLGNNAFNLANTSQGLKYDYFLFNKFDCPNLSVLILPISYSTFFGGKIENGSEWYRAIFYRIYMDYPEHSVFSRYNYEFTNMRVFRVKLRSYFNPSKDLGFDEYGWGSIYRLADKDTVKWNNGSEAIEAAKRHTSKNWEKALSNAKEKYAMLEDIASICKKKNILLVLITTPCWRDYTNMLDKRQLSTMYDLISQFPKSHDVVYLDYLRDDRFEPNDFYDSNHLSDIGAVKFSKILRDDIKKYQNKQH